MDEPSAALSAPETVQLHDIVRSLAAAATTIVLISHFLREVLELADTVTVLRDGKVVRTSPTAEETEATLVEAMLGRPLDDDVPAKRPAAAGRAGRARRRGAARSRRRGRFASTSARARSSGLRGSSGRVAPSWPARSSAPAGSRRASRCSTSDRPLGKSPRRSLDAGLAMIPESRQGPGADLRSLRRRERHARAARPTQPARRRQAARRAAVGGAESSIAARCAAPGTSAPVGHAVRREPAEGAVRADAAPRARSVLLADEPTRGVDVGAKLAIYELLGLAGCGGHGDRAHLLRARGDPRARAPGPRHARGVGWLPSSRARP